MIHVRIPDSAAIVALNELVCREGGNPHACNNIGKVESALHTAFYPGSEPFIHGDISALAGAVCFYLVQSHAFVDGNKRTGALTAIAFLNSNGFELEYSIEPRNELADIIQACAASSLSKDELILWFSTHAVPIAPTFTSEL